MNGRLRQIGFSQRIRLEWFEQTTRLILAGNDRAAIKNSLENLLQDKVSVGSQAVRGNRGKVISILMKTWLTVPAGLERLRDEGLKLLRGLTGSQTDRLDAGSVSASSCEAVRPHSGSDRESKLVCVSYSVRAGRTCRFFLPSFGYPAARDE